MKNVNKTIYCLLAFLKSSPVFLFSSSHTPASPFPLPSIHPPPLLPPGTAVKHYPLGLCNTEHPSFPLLSLYPSQDAEKKSVARRGLYTFTWQFLCLYKKVTNNNYSLQMSLAHSTLLPEIIWKCFSASLQVPNLVPHQSRTSSASSGHFISRCQEARAKLWDCKWGKTTQPCWWRRDNPQGQETAGAGKPWGRQSWLTRVHLPKTASSFWQSSLYLHNTQQSADPAQSCWTLQ